MALEVQEIGIRMRVDPNRDDPGGSEAGAAAAKAKAKSESDDCGCSDSDPEAIVNECVRRVLQTLDAFGQR